VSEQVILSKLINESMDGQMIGWFTVEIWNYFQDQIKAK